MLIESVKLSIGQDEVEDKNIMAPFFSVVIPTKDRSQIVGYAIESALRQTFQDFEVILVDNDGSDKTAHLVQKYRANKRLKYFRTGNLSMSDNWEFGVNQASGKYITILEDKQLLRKHALEYTHNHISDEKHKVVTFPYSNIETPEFNQAFCSRLVPGSSFLSFKPQQDIANKAFTISTDAIFNKYFFKTGRTESLPYLPRGITSFVHHSVVEKIQDLYFGRLCDDVNPDYVMAFQQLAVVDEILVLPKRLSIVGNKVSNGFQLRTKKQEATRDFIAQLREGENAFYDQVPIKRIIIWNAIINDFLRIQKAVGLNLKDIQLPREHYYTYCYWDIALSASLGADASEDLQEWAKALRQEDGDVQKTVHRNTRLIRIYKLLILIGSLGNRLDVFRIQLFLKRIFKLSPVFSSPIELLEWEEKTFPEIYLI